MSNLNLPENESQTMSEETNQVEVVENKKPEEKKNNSLIHILLGAILVVLLLLLLTQCQGKEEEGTQPPQGNDSAIIDGELELMGYEEIKAGLQSKVDESYMNLKINLNPVFEGLNGKGNLMIQNSKSNMSNIQVSIYLEETNQLIYTSPVLKPNQSISEDVLTETENLEPGTHKALAMFSILNPETGDKTSETGIKLTITIK